MTILTQTLKFTHKTEKAETGLPHILNSLHDRALNSKPSEQPPVRHEVTTRHLAKIYQPLWLVCMHTRYSISRARLSYVVARVSTCVCLVYVCVVVEENSKNFAICTFYLSSLHIVVVVVVVFVCFVSNGFNFIAFY